MERNKYINQYVELVGIFIVSFFVLYPFILLFSFFLTILPFLFGVGTVDKGPLAAGTDTIYWVEGSLLADFCSCFVWVLRGTATVFWAIFTLAILRAATNNCSTT